MTQVVCGMVLIWPINQGTIYKNLLWHHNQLNELFVLFSDIIVTYEVILPSKGEFAPKKMLCCHSIEEKTIVIVKVYYCVEITLIEKL